MKRHLLIILWQLFVIILAIGLAFYRWQSEAMLVPAITCGLSVLLAGLPLPLLAGKPVVLYRTGQKAGELGVTVRRAHKCLAALAEARLLVIGSSSQITNCEPFISQLIPEGISQGALLALAASVEREATDTNGQLIYNTAMERRLRLQPAIGYNKVPGQGVEAVVSRVPVRVGSAAWLKSEKVDISAQLLTKADQLAQRGKLPLFVSSGKYARGIIVIEDEISMDTISALHRLQRMGFSLLLLTTASKRMANAIRKQTGIDEIRHELAPSAKEREVQLLRTRESAIAMLGDPESDAAALNAADVRIAWQAKPAPEKEEAPSVPEEEPDELKEIDDLPPEPASAAQQSDKPVAKIDITIPHGDFLILARLRHRAENAMQVVKQNHYIAFAAYLLLLPLASGLLTPFGIPALDPFMAFCANTAVSFIILLLSLRA